MRTEETIASNAMGKISAYFAVVKAEPSVSSEIVGYLKSGDPVYIVNEIGNSWTYIISDTYNLQGYVPSSNIEKSYSYALSANSGPMKRGVLVRPSANSDSSSDVLRQTNSALNYNIRINGAAFMCCCFLGGLTTVSEVNTAYYTAITKGWMTSSCTILSWSGMKKIAGASTYRVGSATESPDLNEKEIVLCYLPDGSYHYVVGDGTSEVVYDPIKDGYASYSSAVGKVFYGY